MIVSILRESTNHERVVLGLWVRSPLSDFGIEIDEKSALRPFTYCPYLINRSIVTRKVRKAPGPTAGESSQVGMSLASRSISRKSNEARASELCSANAASVNFG